MDITSWKHGKALTTFFHGLSTLMFIKSWTDFCQVTNHLINKTGPSLYSQWKVMAGVGSHKQQLTMPRARKAVAVKSTEEHNMRYFVSERQGGRENLLPFS